MLGDTNVPAGLLICDAPAEQKLVGLAGRRMAGGAATGEEDKTAVLDVRRAARDLRRGGALGLGKNPERRGGANEKDSTNKNKAPHGFLPIQ